MSRHLLSLLVISTLSILQRDEDSLEHETILQQGAADFRGKDI